MSDGEDFLKWRAERDAAFLAMDKDYVRLSLGRKDLSDDMCEMILHKSRYECTALPDLERRASADWLRKKGYRRMTGDAILEGDELPK